MKVRDIAWLVFCVGLFPLTTTSAIAAVAHYSYGVKLMDWLAVFGFVNIAMIFCGIWLFSRTDPQ